MIKQVELVKPIAPYVGGKFKLAKTIISEINNIPHDCYAEPFVGMGGVFLRRTQRPKSEIINDYNRDVTNLFRIVQRHHEAFVDCFKFALSSRFEFKDLIETNVTTLTDIERAVRFLYLQRLRFGGKPNSNTFGLTTDRGARFNIYKLRPMLKALHKRLADVVIECLNYSDFINSYDRTHTLFYIDPPYYKCENYYGTGLFERADFKRLAKQLANIKGKFLMSINDTPEIREMYKDFNIKEVHTSYSMDVCSRKKVIELLIKNKRTKE